MYWQEHNILDSEDFSLVLCSEVYQLHNIEQLT